MSAAERGEERPGSAALRALWLDDEPAPIDVDALGWRLQIRGDSLDDLTCDGIPVLRALRVVVRDRNWNTVPADLEPLEVVHTTDALELVLRGRNRDAGMDFAWRAHVLLRPGSLSAELTGEARSALWRNRIGLILLHHPDLAGSPLTVEHPDGSATSTRFPDDIAPHQPARDIGGLAWTCGGAGITARFSGDVFEMEDQRNWTDASFKTYSTPLDRPFPVQLAAGDRVEQAVTLTCRLRDDEAPGTAPAGAGDGLPAAPARRDAGTGNTLRLLARDHRVPEVTVGASTAPGSPPPGSPTPATGGGVAAVHPGRALPWMEGVGVLVELDLAAPNWRQVLERARSDASGSALDVRLVTDDIDLLGPALDALAGTPVSRIAAFSATTHVSEPPLWQALEEAVRERGSSAQVLAGTRAHFTELNRNVSRLPAAAVTFSLTAQMHDTARTQVVESVPVQRLVAEQAVRLGGGRPVHVGPVTLRSRFNAVATTPPQPETSETVDAGYGAEHVPGATDPRQRSRAYAAWLVASAAALGVPGVASVCFAEAWGPRGFGTADGRAFPAAGALSWISELSGWSVLEPDREPPRGVSVLAARRDEDTVVLAANLADRPQRLRIDLGAAGLARIEGLPHGDDPAHADRSGATRQVALHEGVLDISLAPGEALRCRHRT